LVSFENGIGISLFDIAQMKIELEEIFKRPVDILEKEALRNPYRKRQILETFQVIYEA
jgi:predicted nucleotidyltransferase